MDSVIRYFDLASEIRPKRPREKGEGAPPAHWLPQYLALLLGIVVQPFIQGYMATGTWSARGFWGWVLASVIIALMAFPAVYKNSFDPGKPVAVQFAIIFSSGMGWQSIVGASLKVANAT